MAGLPRGLGWADIIVGRVYRVFDLFHAEPAELLAHADGPCILVALLQ
ncbi:MAG: hypothetical protein M3442_08920 [Chloroflexota bacterium]|nr:hypothetical protein [Chloroflexota bacterium]